MCRPQTDAAGRGGDTADVPELLHENRNSKQLYDLKSKSFVHKKAEEIPLLPRDDRNAKLPYQPPNSCLALAVGSTPPPLIAAPTRSSASL